MMKYPKLFYLKDLLRSFFGRSHTARPTAPEFIPRENFRGTPRYYKQDCVGCAACARVCPSSAIEVIDDLKTRTRKLLLKLESCIFCGNCQANCITKKGIALGSEYQTAVYDKSEAAISVEKELLVCDYCEKILAAKDHIKFLSRKLGPLAYGSPLLIWANQEELKLGDIENPKRHRTESEFGARPHAMMPADRSAMFKVLCPDCRRQVG